MLSTFCWCWLHYNKSLSKTTDIHCQTDNVSVNKIRESSNQNLLLSTGSHKNPVLWMNYNGLNMKIERISRIFHLILTRMTLAGLILPSILITIGNYFILDLGVDSYYLSCPLWFVWNYLHANWTIRFIFPFPNFRLPFSWRTPAGFVFAIFIESLSGFSVVYSILPVACFTVGSYLLLVAAIKVITNDFRVLCSKIAIENGKKLKELFVCVILDIIRLKKLSFSM